MWLKEKSLEDREYIKFYFIQWAMFFSSISKGTAIGFVTYKLQLSAIELAIFAAMSTLGALGTYLISPILRDKSRNLEMFFVSTQVLNIFFTSIALLYSFYCYWVNSWGSFYIWLVINFFLCLSIYLEPTARSIYVKKRFPNFDFASITRSDVMTMGFAKIMGFGAGVFIISSLAVVGVYFISLVCLILFLKYLIKQVKLRPFKKIEKSLDSSKANATVDKLDYKTTLLILILNASFFTALNTQTVTYSNMWGVPFYVFAVFGSLGNIFFSFFINKKPDLTLKTGFNKYIYLVVIGFCCLYFLSGYWTLIGFLILGGVGSTMHVYSTSRLYSSAEGRDTRKVSMYYLIYNIAFALSALLFGVLIQYAGINNVFLAYIFLPALFLYLVKRNAVANLEK